MALQTATTLGAVAYGGLIREDVMEKIWDISKIPLPFTDMIGTDKATASYTEWTKDTLAAPDVANAVLDGADQAGDNNSSGTRVGNHCQISVKYVTVSTRARKVKTIGFSDSLSYQVMMRQRELRRDVEAIMLTQHASRADNGTLTGLSAGFGAWLTTNTDRGAGAGADGGFASGVVAAPVAGTTRALTETMIRDMVESIYTQGGDPSTAMSVPKLIRQISSYLFTSSARVATLQSDQGKSGEKATALGAVNIFVTDFGTLELIPNRLQQATVATAGSRNVELNIIDPMYLRQAFLSGYETEILAKTGLSDKRQMSVDWCLKMLSEEGQGIIADIDDEAVVTYS